MVKKKKASVPDYIRCLASIAIAKEDKIEFKDVPEDVKKCLKKVRAEEGKMKKIFKKDIPQESYSFLMGPSILTFDQDKYLVTVGSHGDMTMLVTKR